MKNFKNLKIYLIPPEEYDTHSYLHDADIRKQIKEYEWAVYYMTFRYKERYGYKYILLTQPFINDPKINIDDYISHKCYEWAAKNYKENK